jgi:hypothetical protein
MISETTLFSATLGEDQKIEPPLGPLYIASALENAGWKVDFRDYQLFEGVDAFDPGKILKCLKGSGSVVMISCFVDMLPMVIAAAESIKRERPGTYHPEHASSPTGNRAVGQPSMEALRELFVGTPAVTRDEVIQQSLRATRLIGSPGYPSDEEEVAARAGRAYDRSYDPVGSARQAIATIASRGSN